MERKDALALDRADPFAKKRKLFKLPKGKIYLDGNSLGVLPKASITRVKHLVEVEWGQDLITSWNKHGWWNLPHVVGNKIAKLIGAAPNSVAVADTISVNLFKILSAAVTMRPQRNVILSDSGNFPSDLYVAQGLSKFLQGGISLKIVEPEQVMAAISEEVAVVMLTETDYRSARRHDMQAITAKAHSVGALVIWDVAHSAGAVPIDLMACDADFAVGCTYKYLNGGPGAQGFLFVNPKLQHEAVPALVGWWGHTKPFAFSTDFVPADGVRRFQSGTQGMLNMVALDAAMDAWKGISMERLYSKAVKQCAMFTELVEQQCSEFGVSLYGERNFHQRGSHVCLQHEDAYAVMQALIRRGVVGDFRAPNLMRFGFTPLYTSYADVFDAVNDLHEVLFRRLWNRKKFLAKQSVT
jgi:kynureninase